MKTLSSILVKTLTDQVESAQQDVLLMLELVDRQPLLAPPRASAHLALVPKDPGTRDRPTPYVKADRLLDRVPDAAVAGERIAPWNAPGYLATLAELAEAFDMSLRECAQRYGQVTLPAQGHDRGWRFHPALGFTKWR